jgi:DNA polymerase I
VTRKSLYLVDGMSHIYRAYYAIRGLSNSKGMPTNAVYGFTAMLRRLIEAEKPDYIGVAFDLEGPTVRHEQFEQYKATRKPMPDDLVPQIPYVRRVCDAFRVPVIGFGGYEADDVIGTLSRAAVERGLRAVIVTSDKDMLQLVTEDVTVLDPMKDNLVLDAARVVEKMGVRPDQVADLLGLWGDSVDNIPGAPGIGEKGAKELIQTFGSLEECLRNWDKAKRKRYQASLRDNVELIRMSRALATIRRDLPIDLDLEALRLSEPDRRAAFDLFSELEFKTLMKEFLDEEQVTPPVRAASLSGAEAEGFLESLSGQERVYFALTFDDAPFRRRIARKIVIQGETGPSGIVDLSDPRVAAACARVLGDPSLTRVCWDAKLSLLALQARGIQLDVRTDDVMLFAFLGASHIGDYTLRRWALDQLHVSLAPESRNGQGSLPVMAGEELEESLTRELDTVRRLHGLLSARIEEMGLRKVYDDLEGPLVPVLAAMEKAGIRVRRETLSDLSSELEKQIGDLTGRIYGEAGVQFNINSPKQLGEILFEKLHLPTFKKTKKTGGYSTDQTVLEELANSYEIPRLILEYRQLSKLKGTYVDSLPTLIDPSTGRVHTFFNQTGAATGRLSSSDPNLQNIPVRTEVGRLIRGAFIPDDGNVFISADYSQIELRVLAHLSGDEVLTDAFRNDEDVHDRTAREVFTAEQLANRSECRRRAKVINFGIVYGLSAFGLSQRLGIPRDEAQAFIDAYFERYKGVRIWLDRTVEEVRRDGCARTLFGRVRPIPDISSRDYQTRQFAERTAVNSPIQGTAADIIKVAMIRLHSALQSNPGSGRILLQVHDELVLEVPRERAGSTADLVRREMEGAAILNVPLRVDVNTADNWKDMK